MGDAVIASLRAIVSFALLLAAASCGEDIQEQYLVEIKGPIDVDYLAGVKEVALDVAGREVARASITPGRPFNLVGKDIDPVKTKSGVLGVRALDGAGRVLAFGTSPEIELALLSPRPLSVFVQAPGTFARAENLRIHHKGHVALATVGLPPDGSSWLPITVAFFGTGRVINPQSKMPSEVLSNSFQIYNPLDHLVRYEVGASTAANNEPKPRADAAALVRPDGRILVFGGNSAPSDDPVRPSAQLDLLRVRRIPFADFVLVPDGSPRTSFTTGVARSHAAITSADVAYAFGGRDENGPLDTIVAIDPAQADAMKLLDLRMGAPRLGHTATAVAVDAGVEVLVVGGAPPGGLVAEVFIPGAAAQLVSPQGDHGSDRRDHAAILLPPPDGRVLVIGGLEGPGSGVPRGDSLVYLPRDRAIEPGPITLATPRSAFAAFVIDGELVVSGGLDAQGVPVKDAEVFSIAERFRAKGVVPAHGRSRATATLLPNHSVVVIGGQEPGGAPTGVVEIYQPAR